MNKKLFIAIGIGAITALCFIALKNKETEEI